MIWWPVIIIERTYKKGHKTAAAYMSRWFSQKLIHHYEKLDVLLTNDKYGSWPGLNRYSSLASRTSHLYLLKTILFLSFVVTAIFVTGMVGFAWLIIARDPYGEDELVVANSISRHTRIEEAIVDVLGYVDYGYPCCYGIEYCVYDVTFGDILFWIKRCR